MAIRWFANIETVLVAYLGTIPGVGGVSTDLPAGLVPGDSRFPFVQPHRIASGGDDGRTDSPVIDINVFHSDRLAALMFSRQVHYYMLRLRHSLVGGVPIDDVRTVNGFAWIDYQDPNLKRYLASYVVQSRRNAQIL